MTENGLAFWMTVVGTICWGFCFWWMRQLSRQQNDLLTQLREQVKEVYPQVNEIKEGMDAMIAVVTDNLEHQPPVIKRK
jgi:hypothetical protein